MPKKQLFIIIILLCLSRTLSAQVYQHYTTSNGLSSADVTAICENEFFLWIATSDGLNRYDGKQFKIFKKDYGSANSLSENNIETLMFDSSGLLWIGLKTGGVDIYNPRENTFTHISQYTDSYPQRVISIYEDSYHNIWLGSWGEGAFRLTVSETGYQIEQFYPGYIVSGILEKPENKLWLGTYYGHLLYDLEKNTWKEIPSTESAVTQLLDTDEKNSLYFSTWNSGMSKVTWDDSFEHIKEKHIPDTDGDIYRIYWAGNNRIFMGTWGNGLKSIEINDHFEKPGFIKEYPNVEAPVILSFFRDKYENLWIGTYGSGLFCINENNRGIDIIQPINENGFSPAYALKYLSDNQILIGSQGNGLFLYDLNTSTLIPQYLQPHSSSIFNKYILSFYSDEEVLIVGSDDEGLYYVPQDQKQPTSLNLKYFSADKHLTKVTSIFKDRSGKIWLGTKQDGLISLRYDAKNKTFTDYTHYDVFATNEITGLSESTDGQLWVFSHGGISLFDPRLNRINKLGDSSIDGMIYSITDDKMNQCLWLGTSVGLRKMSYSPDKEVDNAFSESKFPLGAIKDVILDSNNNLWFSIAERVFCYQDNIKRLHEINIEVWNSKPIYSSTKAIIEGKEYIIFGGTDKLLKIDPVKALNQPNINKILLTELQIDSHKVNVNEEIYGRIILNEETEYTQAITLSYKCKWISLFFTEIGWNNYKNRYQYKIEGFSDNWQHLDISKPITFSQLPSGDYTLRIAQAGYENDSNNQWALHLSIIPPWWKTNLFNGMLFILCVITLFGILLIIKNHYKKRQIMRLEEIEKKKKEELVQEKELFFMGLSHDLLTPFSLIIAPTNDLLREKGMTEEQQEKLEIISKNASFLSNIFSTILDFKRVELYDNEIKEQRIEIVSFVQMAVNVFEYMAKSKNIKLNFSSNINELPVKSDMVKIERILYNLISNALKYTRENDSIDVKLIYNHDDTYIIEVIDTGIGIAPESLDKIFQKFYQEKRAENPEGLGLGLYITQKFVSALGGRISIDSEIGRGTSIRIELPANNHEETVVRGTKVPEESENIYSILLVEDNDQLRNYLSKKLSGHFDVATASNGKQALELIRKNLPEIVISDVMMPEMDGLELCSEIKNTPVFSDIFVILLSARASVEDELKGYQAGADFYLKKPFESDALINQIVNVYTTRQQRRKQIIGELLSPETETAFDPKDEFLQSAIKIVEEHLIDEDFKIDEFALKMKVSKSVLHRKFKLLLGETPNTFIRNIRLRNAANLLKNSNLSISEIAYTTGFSQSHYFIKCFKEVYKDTPKNYRIKHQQE